MARYRTTMPLDDVAARDGDSGFRGVDMRRDPAQLEAGVLAAAVNMDFMRGMAETRPSLETRAWGRLLALDFPLNFVDEDTRFYELFGAEITTVQSLNYRVYDGTTFQLRNRVSGLWHTVWIEMVAGVASLAIDPTGTGDWVYAAENVAAANYRRWGGHTLQILCPGTGLFHTIYLDRVGSAVVLAIDQTGQTAGATAPVQELTNWRIFRNTTLQLLEIERERYHSLWIEPTVTGVALAIEQAGNKEKGVDFDKEVGFGEVFGTLTFSDPYGQEMTLIAVRMGVFLVAEGYEPELIRVAGGEFITGRVHMVQAFDRVLMFRGEQATPLVWIPVRNFQTGWGQFESITQSSARNDDEDNDYGDGTQPIPNSDFATVFNNRVYALVGRDEIAVSDILDYTRYSEATQKFRINSGTDDQIMAIAPWNKTTLVAFKSQSIYILSNVYGNLQEVTADVLTREYGLVARDAWVGVGNDILFLSEAGWFSIRQALDNQLQMNAEPLTAPIQPLIDQINWPHAGAAVMAYHENRVFMGVPLFGSTKLNGLIVFNTVTRGFSGYWTADFFDLKFALKAQASGKRRLFFVNGASAAARVHQGAMFQLGAHHADYVHGTWHPIATDLMTRAYSMGGLDEKRFNRLNIDLATWAPEFSVDVQTDGVNEVYSLQAGETRNRTAWWVWGVPAFDETNADHNHGDARRKDYSVLLTDAVGLLLGDAGVDPQRMQRVDQKYFPRVRGTWMQVRVRNVRGRATVFGINVEAQRATAHYREKA